MGAFERWSYEHLGQWHYVLGYLIVLMSHNWPLLLSVGLCLWWGAWLYRHPTRARVCWFFGGLLLGLGYEYGKHVAPTLHASLDTIVGAEILWLNQAAHVAVGPVMQILLFAATALFWGHGLWLEATGLRPLRAKATTMKGDGQCD